MSERDVIEPTGITTTVDAVKASDNYGIPDLDEARVAEVLSRSQSLDHLSVQLPDNLHGEWVPADEMSIYQKEKLGFVKCTHDIAKTRFTHSDGSGVVRLGDCIYMITTKKNMELIDRVRAEQFRAVHNPKKAKEEKEFAAQVKQETGGVIPTYTESSNSTETADAERIRQALES